MKKVFGFKKFTKLLICILGGISLVIAVYALTKLFYSKSVSSNYGKKVIFEFDLNTDLSEVTLGPGDSTDVNAYIENTATENMFVFIKIDMPVYEQEPIYEFETDDSWVLVDSEDGSVVYAYAGDEMTVLYPGEVTEVLMDKITMKKISNAAYSYIDDINIKITGYGLGTDGMNSNIQEVWDYCKVLIE
jgi:hypothetical protein